jgi:hypothetical protein
MVCDRVAIMLKGEVVSQGTFDELTTGRQRYDIEIDGQHADVAAHAFRTALADIAVLEPPPPSGQPPTVRGTLKTGEKIEMVGLTLQLGTSNPIRVQALLD